MLLLSDPAVAAVPVRDCEEELVDVRTVDGLLLDRRKEDAAGAWARLRAGVVTRLLEAQRSLPGGARLLVVEGHRPAALQERYFEEYRASLARTRPDWSAQQLHVEASRYVSPPAVAPHPCGAAVDLTLVHDDGAEVDMGCPVNATPAESANACFTAATDIPGEAQQWRRVLGDALTGAGLVNYPPEWWHWSYGDRYWAVVTDAPHAVYGPR